MLVLTRRASETIVIGEITLTIVRVIGEKVRVGIEAPKDVNIVRGELINAPASRPNFKSMKGGKK